MNSGYTQDVKFNSAFDALQAPTHLFTAAVICGFAPPAIDRPFRYLDLACGNGLTLTILADAYPHGDFVGIDLNGDHVADANALANLVGVRNVRFFQGDIQDLEVDQCGKFEFVAASGVYAWLDHLRQLKLHELLARATRPGGLIYLDYSAQPGIAQIVPLYHMLQKLAEGLSGNSAQRLRAAAEIVDNMRRQGGRFFEANSLAARRLQTILANPAEDEAHEVLNFQGGGVWSHDVIASMNQAGCHYVGSAGLHHNLQSVKNAGRAKEFEGQPPIGEMLSDVHWNVYQRRDIYMRHSNDRMLGTPRESLAHLPIYAMSGALRRDRRQALARRRPEFPLASIAADYFAQEADAASSFDSIFAALGRRGMSDQEVEDLCSQFLASRLMSVAIKPPASDYGKQTVAMPSCLNRHLLSADLNLEHARPLSSPVVGSRVLLPLKERLFIWASLGYDLAEAWERLGPLQSLFNGPGGVPMSADMFATTITENLPIFRRHVAPELIRMGILDGAAV